MIEYHKQYVYQVGYNRQTSNWYNVQSLYRLYNVESIILKNVCIATKQSNTYLMQPNFFLSDGVIT